MIQKFIVNKQKIKSNFDGSAKSYDKNAGFQAQIAADLINFMLNVYNLKKHDDCESMTIKGAKITRQNCDVIKNCVIKKSCVINKNCEKNKSYITNGSCVSEKNNALNLLNSNSVFADIGSGTGEVTHQLRHLIEQENIADSSFLHQKCAHILYDLSDEMMSFALKKVGNSNNVFYRVSDIEKVDDFFDFSKCDRVRSIDCVKNVDCVSSVNCVKNFNYANSAQNIKSVDGANLANGAKFSDYTKIAIANMSLHWLEDLEIFFAKALLQSDLFVFSIPIDGTFVQFYKMLDGGGRFFFVSADEILDFFSAAKNNSIYDLNYFIRDYDVTFPSIASAMKYLVKLGVAGRNDVDGNVAKVNVVDGDIAKIIKNKVIEDNFKFQDFFAQQSVTLRYKIFFAVARMIR